MEGKKYLGMNFLKVMFSLGLLSCPGSVPWNSLEISGMLQLGHKVVKIKNNGLDQVIEGCVIRIDLILRPYWGAREEF